MSDFLKEDVERKVTLQKGDRAPNFSLKNQDGVEINLNDFIGKNVILYFYPKDNTPGCTKEACEFSQNYDEFIANDSVIIGISPDSVKSHENFIKKHDLKHILLSDEDKNVSADEKYLGDDGEIDLSKFTPITYDPVHHGYYRLGERVGNAFKDGAKLK